MNFLIQILLLAGFLAAAVWGWIKYPVTALVCVLLFFGISAVIGVRHNIRRKGEEKGGDEGE